MAEKNCFDTTKLIVLIMSVTVVQWSSSYFNVQINRVRLPATLLSVFFLNTFLTFGLFFFILTADPAGHALGPIYIFKLKSGVLFWKRDYKSS